MSIFSRLVSVVRHSVLVVAGSVARALGGRGAPAVRAQAIEGTTGAVATADEASSGVRDVGSREGIQEGGAADADANGDARGRVPIRGRVLEARGRRRVGAGRGRGQAPKLAILLASTTCVLLALGTAPAFASQVHPLIGSFTGADSTAGPFAGSTQLAVSQTSGNVFVLDQGNQLIDQFDSSGTAVPFRDSSANGNGIPVGPFSDQFFNDAGVAVDNSSSASDGNIYFASEAQQKVYGFDATGAPLPNFPMSVGDACGVAVDPNGHLWVARIEVGIFEYDSGGHPLGGQQPFNNDICHFAFDNAGNLYPAAPCDSPKYNPTGGGGFIPDATTPDLDNSCGVRDVATDLVTGDVYFLHTDHVSEFDKNGAPVETFGSGELSNAIGIGVDAATGHVYVSDTTGSGTVYVYGNSTTLARVRTGTASSVAVNSATLNGSVNPLGVEVTDCHFDYGTTTAYGASAPCAETVGSGSSAVAVHADISSLTPGVTYHFRLVAANANGTVVGSDHTFGPPELAQLHTTGLTPSSVTVGASINPNGADTTYHIEYGRTASYGQSTPESASIGSDNTRHSVSQAITGLNAATTYHYRIVATNVRGTTQASDRTFTTHASSGSGTSDNCPNVAYRWGPSAKLPECRAYELVSPRDTNAQTPYTGIGGWSPAVSQTAGNWWDTSSASTDGNAYLFYIYGTIFTGFEGNGYSNVYRAQRGADGWTTHQAELTHDQSPATSTPGSASGDLRWEQFGLESSNPAQYGSLSLPVPGHKNWLRHPDGSVSLIGEGTLPADPDTDGWDNGKQDYPGATLAYMSKDTRHQVVWTQTDASPPPPLTADAPTDGSPAVYDRTPTGLHLVSILPDNSLPVGRARYAGASDDGSVSAFMTGDGLYVRINDQSTQLVASGSSFISDTTGVDSPGWTTDHEVVYVKGGDLFRYDIDTKQTTQITSTGDALLVRVSDDASRVFFVSRHQLDGSKGAVHAPNLYVWDGSSTHFITVVRDKDLYNADNNPPSVNPRGLAWTTFHNFGMGPPYRQGANMNTARTTRNGSVLAFLSSANLTGQNPDGYEAVYRYDVASDNLACVSCAPDGSDTTADSRFSDIQHTGSSEDIPNLSNDGRTVFFESDQDLVPADHDGLTSVYEWHDGHLYLISSGESGLPDHLLSATPDGSEVFFLSSAALVPNPQQGGVPGIYTARIDGGFPVPASAAPCAGDACRGESGGAPPAPPAGSQGFVGSGNPAPGGARSIKVEIASRSRTVTGTSFSLKIRTPGAGRLTVAGTHLRTVRRTVTKSRSLTFKLRLTAKGALALKRQKRLHVLLRVRFVPRVGKRSVTTARFTVKLPPAKKAVHATTTRGASR